MKELLREGIAAAKSGDRERARDLLTRVVGQDEQNVLAWLWLSGVVDSLEDQEICLENVLTLDPSHEAAREGLAWLREQGGTRASAPAEGELSPDLSRASQPAEAAVSPAVAVLRDDFARRWSPPEAEPELPPFSPRDEFEDEYQCIYCAACAEPEDRECPGCGKKLWIRIRRREERSSWLWVALTLQFASVVWPAMLVLSLLVFAGQQAGLENFSSLVPVYLGLPGELSPEMAKAALRAVPRIWVVSPLLFISFSLAVLVGLYLRLRTVFYLFLVNALLMVGSGIAGVGVGLRLPSEAAVLNQRTGALCGGGLILIGLLMFLLLLQIEDDFFFAERRLLLRPDRDATNGPALLSSGRHYAKSKKWAMAAIHLRRAAAQMPHQADPHLALSVAYLNLKRDNLAAGALEEARRIDPDHSQIEHLTNLLMSQRAAQYPAEVNNTE